MIHPGSIVLQKNTLVNKINFKDNKINRLSVVLFEFIYNNEEYICSCPITNHVQTINNFSKNYIYIPYQILDNKKYCSIKLDSVYFYPKKDITLTGLELNNNIVLKIYDKLMNIESDSISLTSEKLNILKENILNILKQKKKEEKRILKETKKLKKLKRKESKRNNIK